MFLWDCIEQPLELNRYYCPILFGSRINVREARMLYMNDALKWVTIFLRTRESGPEVVFDCASDDPNVWTDTVEREHGGYSSYDNWASPC